VVIGPGETVTVLRPGTVTDRYGDSTKDWSDPDRTDVAGCHVAPGSAGGSAGGAKEETAAGREGVVVTYDVFFPAGTDVRPGDRAEVRGDVFDVDGEPADWRSPYTGRHAGIHVALRTVEG
jgi:head-tail adaptor